MRHGIYNGNRNASKIEELWNIPLRQGDELSIDLISEKKMEKQHRRDLISHVAYSKGCILTLLKWHTYCCVRGLMLVVTAKGIHSKDYWIPLNSISGREENGKITKWRLPMPVTACSPSDWGLYRRVIFLGFALVWYVGTVAWTLMTGSLVSFLSVWTCVNCFIYLFLVFFTQKIKTMKTSSLFIFK